MPSHYRPILLLVSLALPGCADADPKASVEGSATSGEDGGDEVSTSGHGTSAVTSGGHGESGDGGVSSGAGSTSIGSVGESEDSGGSSESVGEDGSTGGDAADALHVSDLGLDSNPGTPDLPMRTISRALVEASDDPGIVELRVAGGRYEVDVANAGPLVLVDGISISGGWDAAFSERDSGQWPSVLVDVSAEQVPDTTEVDPARLVEAPGTVSPDTVFEGFRIELGQGFHRAGVFAEGSPTLRENTFVRGAASPCTTATAVVVEGGAPRVIGNRISFDFEGQASMVRGIGARFADATIASNVISLVGPGAASGIDLYVSESELVGNSILSCGGMLIRLQDSTPTIDNNLLLTEAFGSCVASLTAQAVPETLRNNLLQCHHTVWGNAGAPFSPMTTISEVHTQVPGAAGNVKLTETPSLDPEVWLALDHTVPCSVARGGRDLSALHPEDGFGNLRTEPVSIGAHEWDGACE